MSRYFRKRVVASARLAIWSAMEQGVLQQDAKISSAHVIENFQNAQRCKSILTYCEVYSLAAEVKDSGREDRLEVI